MDKDHEVIKVLHPVQMDHKVFKDQEGLQVQEIIQHQHGEYLQDLVQTSDNSNFGIWHSNAHQIQECLTVLI